VSGLEIAGLLLSGLSGGAMVLSGFQDSAVLKAQAQQADQVAQANRQSAAYEAERISDARRRHIASARAQFGASGVDPGSGSALRVLETDAAEFELDRLAALYSGEVGANAATADAAISRSNARTARMGGFVRAASTIGGTALRVLE
jgi:type IV secretory pathway VirJ component